MLIWSSQLTIELSVSTVSTLIFPSTAYKVIFENNVGEDARMQYGCVSIYWNADKPGAVLQGETGNLLVSKSKKPSANCMYYY